MQEEENKDADIPTVVETVPEAQQKNEPKKHGKKKKTKAAAKQEVKEEEIITDEDFGPEVDFTKMEGFQYDPEKAEYHLDEVTIKRRPWKIQDVRSFLYLRRLGLHHHLKIMGREAAQQTCAWTGIGP